MNLLRCSLLAALTATLPLLAGAQAVTLPAGVIEGGYNLSGKPFLSPANHPFRFAATVIGNAHGQSGGSRKVSRSGTEDAAVYTSAPVSYPLMLPSPTVETSKFSFKEVGNMMQGWATMTNQGVPHVFLWGHGQFSGDAALSWRTTVTTHASQAQLVLVRLTLPPVGVSGANEQQGYALWRSRLRGELLANGFPVWSTDAVRFATQPKIVNKSFSDKVLLQTFGTPLPFPNDDEDGDAGNNSPSSTQGVSTKKVLFISLGTWPAGSQIDLSFNLRATAHTDPVVAGSNDNRCKQEAAEFFCAGSSVSIQGASGEPPRIYLLQP
jgi:hypothetical protein